MECVKTNVHKVSMIDVLKMNDDVLVANTVIQAFHTVNTRLFIMGL